MRHLLAASTRVLLDLGLVASLALMWVTRSMDPWLPLAFVFIGGGAFVRKTGRASAVRTVLAGATGAAAISFWWARGEAHGRDLLEVPLLMLLGLLFAAIAARHERAQRVIVRDRSRLERTIDALPLAIVAFDDRARVVTWNRTAEQLFGWTAEDVVGRENPIVPGGDEHGSAGIARRILAGEEIRGQEVKRQARDGTVLDLAVFSALLSGGFLVVYEEIGERRRAEQERDDAQRQYRELVEALPLVTYVDEVDDSASNVYTSPQVLELLGWSPDDWLADPGFFESILHPDDRERVMSELAHSNATWEPFQSEYRLLHRDGHAVWVRDHSTIVEGESSRPFARGFLLDITEQKLLEEQLLQAQKMDAIGRLADGIAHDFNNLLTGIRGYADLAEASTGEPIVRRAVDGIKTAAAEAASLTSRLLTFSRRDVPERRLVDLNALVREGAELLEQLVREDVRVTLALAGDLAPVTGDAAQLKQVVLNLALNALDAMDEGGTLTIETAIAGESVALRVRDTGRGMDADTRLRAFEPFFTTKPAGEGTGLGLAAVYGVVEALGGTIEIESAPGRGTTAQVLLPAVTGAELHPAPEPEPASRTARGTESVLVVEDRAVVRGLARDVLEDAGFTVATAPNGPEAVALIEGGATFSLLLTDVVMPELSGPELARLLRASQPHLRVLYMSGYTDDVLDAGVLDEPGTQFVRKPFGIEELTARVRELLDTPLLEVVPADERVGQPAA